MRHSAIFALDLMAVLEDLDAQFGGGGSWGITLRLTPGHSAKAREHAHRRVASLIRWAQRRGLVERPGALWRLTARGREMMRARRGL